MKENKSDVTDAVQHWIAVVVAACAILSGCGRNESAEFEITPPREWDEGISRSRYVVSEDTGKTVLVADNSLLRGERLPTIKEARELIENADAVGMMTDEGRANLIKSLMEKSDHPVAQYLLGMCYYSGTCVDPSQDETLKWWLKAAEQGYREAQCNAGTLLLQRGGGKEDDVAAVKWLRLAAKQGDAMAQCNLAICYRDGLGVEKSEETAIRWFKIAVAHGDEYAKEALKKMGK